MSRSHNTSALLRQGIIAAMAESLFVLLPLIVLTIALLHMGHDIRDLFASPEWSFGGAVLMGQTVVKVVHTTSSIRRGDLNVEIIVFIVAAVIVLLLAPSLIVLSIMLMSESPTSGMILLQVGFFVLGLIAFLIVGTVSYWMLEMSRRA